MAVVQQINGLPELRKALREAGPAWDRDLPKAHRAVATEAAKVVRADARSQGTKQQRRAAVGIRPSASRQGAKLNMRATSTVPFVLGAFYGAQKWRQFPDWVGNTWSAGVKGQGPQPINDSLAEHTPALVGVYGEQLDKVAAALAARKVTSF